MNIELNTAILSSQQSTVAAPAPKDSSTKTFQETLAQASLKADKAQSDKVASAAKQFEALIMGQVLKTARESSDGGWLGGDGDKTGELSLEMAEQEFSKALSTKGGLGIAKLVTTSFDRHAAIVANSGLAAPRLPGQNTDSKRR
jgi:Rod binding domain-containing protein